MKRLRSIRDEENAAYERKVPLFVVLGSLLLYFLRFGYDYGNSDQDEVIPYLLHRLDPGLFTQDWFVTLQVGEFSVRTYFVWLLNALALILPVWLSVLLVYVTTWLLIAGAVYKLTYHFTKDQLASCAAVLLSLLLTPVWTLGGNDLVHSMLVASMVSWALGLWAVYHFLRSRYLLAPVLLGVACWMQALVGLHLAIVLVLVRVVRVVADRDSVETVGGVLSFGLFFALWSSPALGPIVYQQILAAPAGFDPEPSLFYILAEFRLPHHYLPGSFYMHNVVRFGLLGAVAIGSLFWGPFRRQLDGRAFILRSLTIVAVFLLIGWLFTEVVPVLMVAKLQLFKMTVFVKLLFVILISGAFFHWLPQTFRRPIRAVVRRPGWGLTLATIAWIGVVSAAILGEGFLHERVRPFQRMESPVGRMQDWAQRRTPVDAIFSVPPSMSSFRSEAQRTIVVNYKAIPYQDELMVEWLDRLLDMAPIELPERGGPELIDDLDAAYESLGADPLDALAATYNFGFVVRRTPLSGPEPAFREAFTAEDWYVYRRTDEAERGGDMESVEDTTSTPSSQ